MDYQRSQLKALPTARPERDRSWLNNARSSYADDVGTLSTTWSNTIPDRGDLARAGNLQDLGFPTYDPIEEVRAANVESFDGKRLGIWESIQASTVDFFINTYSNTRTLFNPKWNSKVVTLPSGAVVYDNTPITGREVRRTTEVVVDENGILQTVPSGLNGSPDGVLESFAYGGTQLLIGPAILRGLSTWKAPQAFNPFLKDKGIADMMTKVSKLAPSVSANIKFEAAAAFGVGMSTPLGQDGVLSQIFASSSQDELEAYGVLAAANEIESKDVMKHIATVMGQEFMVGVGFGTVVDGVFQKWNKGRVAFNEAKALDALADMQQIAEHEFLPALREVLQQQTAEIAKTVKSKADLTEASEKLAEATAKLNQKQLQLLEQVYNRGRKSTGQKLDELAERAIANHDEGELAIVKAMQHQYYNVQGGKGELDILTGTSEARLKAILEDDAADVSIYGLDRSDTLERMLATRKKNQEQRLRDLQKKANKSNDALVQDKFLQEALSSKYIRVGTDDVVVALAKDVAKIDKLGIDFSGAGKTMDEVTEGLAKEIGFTPTETKNFIQGMGSRAEAIKVGSVLRVKAKTARDDAMLWVKQAATSGDPLDTARALYSIQKANLLTGVARKTAGLDGSALEANKRALELGQELIERVAIVKGALNKPIDEPFGDGLAKLLNDNSEILDKLTKAERNTLEESVVIANQIIENLGGKAAAQRTMKELRVELLKNPASVLKTLADHQSKGWLYRSADALAGYSIANMLSGFGTQLKVVLGGMAQTVYLPSARIVGGLTEASWNKLRHKFFGGSEEAFKESWEGFQDTLSELYGLLSGSIESTVAMGRTAITRRSGFDKGASHEMLYNTKSGYSTGRAVARLKGDWSILTPTKKVRGIAGIPFRLAGDFIQAPVQNLMQAGDEFFKQLHFRASMRTAALKKAKAAKITDPKKINEFVKNEIDTQMAKITTKEGQMSLDKALTVTFQTPLDGGPTAWLADMTNKHPMLKLIVPFIKTSVNMSDEFFESIPFMTLVGKSEGMRSLPAVGAMIRRLRDRTLGAENVWKRQQVLGKQLMMIPFVAVVGHYYNEGKIQGFGPKNLTENRKARTSQGHVPYSIEVNGQRVKFDHLVEPVGMAFRVVTRIYETVDDISREVERGTITIEEGAVKLEKNTSWLLDLLDDTFSVAGSATQQVTEVLPLDGPHRALNALMGGQEVMQSYAADLFATLLPYSGFLSQHRRSYSEYQQASKGYLTRLQQKSIIPLSILDEPLDVDFSGERPVTMYNYRTGKPIDNYNYLTASVGIVISPELPEDVAKYVAHNGALLNLNWRETDFNGNKLPADLQEQWQKIRYEEVRIGGKKYHEAVDAAMKQAIKLDLADSKDFADELARLTPGVQLVNRTIEEFNKLTDVKFQKKNPNLVMAKVNQDLTKELAKVGIQAPKQSVRTQVRGTLKEQEAINVELRKMVTDPQNAFQNKE